MSFDKDSFFDAITSGTLEECYKALSCFDKYNFDEEETTELENIFLPTVLARTKAYVFTIPQSEMKKAEIVKHKFMEFRKATFDVSILKNTAKELESLWNIIDSKSDFQWHLYNFNGFDENRKEYFTFDSTISNDLILNVSSHVPVNESSKCVKLVEYEKVLKYFWHYIYEDSIITNVNTLISLAELVHFETMDYEIELKKHEGVYVLEEKSEFIEYDKKKVYESGIASNNYYRVCAHRLEENYGIFVYYELPVEQNADGEMMHVISEHLSINKEEGHNRPVSRKEAFRFAILKALGDTNAIKVYNAENENHEECNFEDNYIEFSVNKTLAKLDSFLNNIVTKYIEYGNTDSGKQIYNVGIKNGDAFLTPATQRFLVSRTHIQKMNAISNKKKGFGLLHWKDIGIQASKFAKLSMFPEALGFVWYVAKHIMNPSFSQNKNNDSEASTEQPSDIRLRIVCPENIGFTDWNIPKNLNWDKIKDDAIGIDLGTTRCCCAVSRSKCVIETVALDNLPSFVGYDEENVKCGQIVVDRINNYSRSTVFDVKRIIGRKFSDITVDPSWTFSLKSDNYDNPMIETTNHCGNLITLSPSQVSASLLKHIKTKSEEFQGKKLKNVVVTVPAVFTDRQCQETIDAAVNAGWESVTLLPEPVAAAFSYFFDREIPNSSTLLLFDLGGGALDVCIFKIIDDKIKILSNSGDCHIGGRDFDNVLFEYFSEKLENEFNINNIDKKKYKLLSKCQEIKESLSAVNDYSFDVSDFDTTKDSFIKITREKFEHLSHDLMEKIKTIINTALNDKDIQPNEINSILLVGGGSRMPMIENLLSNIFPNVKHQIEINPDEAVAKGAAYFSCYLISNQVMKDEIQQDLEDKEILDESPSEFRDKNVFLKDIKQGPDEVASNRTMESTIVIFPHGLIEGETTLIGNHWLLGFRGGVKVHVYDKDKNLLWESSWRIFGVNMNSTSTRRWDHMVPEEFLSKIKSVSIIHKHDSEIN